MEQNTVELKGLKLGDGIPKICVPIVAKDFSGMRQELLKLTGVPYDLIEWRADHFAGLEDQKSLISALELIRTIVSDKPLLFTIRTKNEGGEADLPFEKYEQINLQAAVSGLVDLVDVELFTAGEKAASITAKLQGLGVRVIGSSHDFEKTPENEDMLGRLIKMQEAGMDISKLAVMPVDREDVLRLIGITVQMREKYADRPFVTMSMGPLGAISRALGSFSGSAFSFGTAGKASAPGQMGAKELKQVLDILA